MTRDGLTEENLRDGTVRDISHKSRGRPEDTSETFVPERERKKKKPLRKQIPQKESDCRMTESGNHPSVRKQWSRRQRMLWKQKQRKSIWIS